jgi:hypothetical protein
VGQIATFHELKARSVIKDVGRAMGMPANEAQALASLIPPNPKVQGQMYTIPEALEAEPKLARRVQEEPVVRDLIKVAQKLEGLTRHAGKHAAGVVISKGPLWDHVPCFLNEGKIVTQYDKDDAEEAGLVKFDFLGLKTLTVLAIAVRLIDARPDRQGMKLDLGALPLDDRLTYQLLQSGETTGVFQLESTGMQQLFKDYRPEVSKTSSRSAPSIAPARSTRAWSKTSSTRSTAASRWRACTRWSTMSSNRPAASSSTRSRSCSSRRSSPATRSAAPISCAKRWARSSPTRWPSSSRRSWRGRARKVSPKPTPSASSS